MREYERESLERTPPGVSDTFATPVYTNSNLISFPQTDNTITLDNILTSKQLQT